VNMIFIFFYNKVPITFYKKVKYMQSLLMMMEAHHYLTMT